MDVRVAPLHKHWVTADAVNFHLRRSVELPNQTLGGSSPENVTELANKLSAFAVLSVWYSLLYVVVEGYREMQLKDEAIDELLASGEYADNLRLFRNATFHFQKDPFSPKVLKFLTANESEIWVRELNRAFKKFFEKELPIENLATEMGLIDPRSSG